MHTTATRRMPKSLPRSLSYGAPFGTQPLPISHPGSAHTFSPCCEDASQCQAAALSGRSVLLPRKTSLDRPTRPSCMAEPTRQSTDNLMGQPGSALPGNRKLGSLLPVHALHWLLGYGGANRRFAHRHSRRPSCPRMSIGGFHAQPRRGGPTRPHSNGYQPESLPSPPHAGGVEYCEGFQDRAFAPHIGKRRPKPSP